MKSKRTEGRDEPILDAELPIVDAHMHLLDLPHARYMLDDYLADAQGGHKVVASIYCETQQFVRTDGPAILRPLGEVEFANGVAAMTASGRYGNCRVAAGIIGHANLSRGAEVGELLDRCLEVAPDRYRGVRQVSLDYPDERPFKFIISGRPPAGLLEAPALPQGLAELQQRELIYDAAIYDPSLPRLTELVDQFPNLVFVINHMGMAVGVDMGSEEKAEMLRTWSANLHCIAERPNVMCKVGGLGMPPWGFGFQERQDVIGYREMADAWRPYVETALDAFGADRCMVESNFPPDGRSGGYIPTMNAFKYIFKDYSLDEKLDLFGRNAVRVYRLNLPAL